MQQSLTEENFGLLAAYLLPGTTLLFGLSYVSPTVQGWLIAPVSTPLSFAGFLFGSLAGLTLGLLVHGTRTVLLDRFIYPLTGLKRPHWQEDNLHLKLPAFNTLVENQFRYHQFWGGMLLSLPCVLVLRRLASSRDLWPLDSFEWVVLWLLPQCFYLSRATLQDYYQRTSSLLGTTALNHSKESESHHGRTCVLQLHGPDQQPSRTSGPEARKTSEQEINSPAK